MTIQPELRAPGDTSPMTPNNPITFKPIGYVENEFDHLAPPDEIRAVESRIVVDPGLAKGLRGLDAGAQILVVFCFHLSRGFDLLQHPHKDKTRPERGVFALRSPHRPNPIGVTEARLIAIDRNVLIVRELDAVNQTPVLDIKPA